MVEIAPNRALLTTVAGLLALGTLALGGLVSPFAGGYLGAGSANGDAAISPTLTPALVRLHVTPPEMARLTVRRDGKPEILLLQLDPDCPPPKGWV